MAHLCEFPTTALLAYRNQLADLMTPECEPEVEKFAREQIALIDAMSEAHDDRCGSPMRVQAGAAR